MKYNVYQIRPATNKDTNEIIKIVFSILVEYGLVPEMEGKDKDLSDIEMNYFKKNGYFGVVENTTNGKLVGTFGIMPKLDGICELRKMFLEKNERGKGVGKFMMSAAIKIALQMNCNSLELETISNLTEAISLYRKFGFINIQPKEINSRVDMAYKLDLLNSNNI